MILSPISTALAKLNANCSWLSPPGTFGPEKFTMLPRSSLEPALNGSRNRPPSKSTVKNGLDLTSAHLIERVRDQFGQRDLAHHELGVCDRTAADEARGLKRQAIDRPTGVKSLVRLVEDEEGRSRT